MKQHPAPNNAWLEPAIFTLCFVVFFGVFVARMGLVNTMNTMMNTAYDLLMNTVFYLMAICVMAGAISALFGEFGVVDAANRLLSPLLRPLYGLPGAASLSIVTTFLSDNPAILTLADDSSFRRYFRQYQLPALTTLGTSFGMGLIVCTYMLGIQGVAGGSQGLAVLMGFAGAVAGSIVSTRLMLFFTARVYGREQMAGGSRGAVAVSPEQPVQRPAVGSRFLAAILRGGKSGVDMGLSIIPGVLIICTFIMMATYGPAAEGGYTGSAYEGIALLPALAEWAAPVLTPLFGFSSAQAVSVPITALGAAGAAMGLAGKLAAQGLVSGVDIAVFTAMCMCWSGYLSTHVSMMESLGCSHLTGKAIFCHTIGGLAAGVSAHWFFLLAAAL